VGDGLVAVFGIEDDDEDGASIVDVADAAFGAADGDRAPQDERTAIATASPAGAAHL
jgi:hypothetical protein